MTKATLADWLDDLAARHGEREALVDGARRWTYAELAVTTERIARGLVTVGVGKETRIGILLPNRAEWLVTAFAGFRLGALVVALNTFSPAPELRRSLVHADVQLLVVQPRFLGHDYLARLGEMSPALPGDGGPLFVPEVPALRHIFMVDDLERLAGAGESVPLEVVRALQSEVAPAELATVFFTSGTTAAPKAPLHDHAALVHQAGVLAEAFGYTPDDRWWAALPLFFTGGFVTGALATLAAGASIVLQAGPDPDAALDLIQHERPTILIGSNLVPALLEHPRLAGTPVAFRKGMAGNTPIIAKFCPADHLCVGTYGMSETATCVTSTRATDPVAVRRGSNGRPLTGVVLRVVDPASGEPAPSGVDGEILVRGPSLMRSYYGLEPQDCFDAEGFFHTGDLGHLDADGSLHFTGRLRDVIKSAGATVSPAEVEAALERHSQVHAACVVPAPDPVRGEVVVAFVVADPGVDEEALRAYCRRELAIYKVPRHFFLRSETDFPRTGTRKPDKLRLRREAAALLGAAT